MVRNMATVVYNDIELDVPSFRFKIVQAFYRALIRYKCLDLFIFEVRRWVNIQPKELGVGKKLLPHMD